METYRDTRETEVCLSCQLTLDIAARLGVSLELGFQGLDLFFGQPGARQVLCVFIVVHNRLVVVIDHFHGRMRVEVAVNGMHHRRRDHRGVIGEGVVHRETRMAGVVP